jgi:tripartite-type tricarboxylate transporter receptor subunit TctC
MFKRLGCKGFIAAITMLFALLSVAQAQDKVVRLIVPFGPGAAQDLMARTISQELGAALGQTVIVENKAGAGGVIGTTLVSRAAPDGQTLDMAAAGHLIAKYVYKNLPYEPLTALVPAGYTGLVGYVLIVPGDSPINSVGDLIKMVKENPGKYNYSSAGNGSITHLAMAYFAGLAGLQMEHIPMKSTGDAVMEVLTGRALATISANIVALGFKDDKRVKLIAVTGAERSKFLPQIPTIAESGLPGYAVSSWFGLLAPAGTPKPVLDKIQAATAKVMKDPVVLERLDKQGVEVSILTNEEFAQVLKESDKQVAEMVKKASVQMID